MLEIDSRSKTRNSCLIIFSEFMSREGGNNYHAISISLPYLHSLHSFHSTQLPISIALIAPGSQSFASKTPIAPTAPIAPKAPTVTKAHIRPKIHIALIASKASIAPICRSSHNSQVSGTTNHIVSLNPIVPNPHCSSQSYCSQPTSSFEPYLWLLSNL